MNRSRSAVAIVAATLVVGTGWSFAADHLAPPAPTVLELAAGTDPTCGSTDDPAEPDAEDTASTTEPDVDAADAGDPTSVSQPDDDPGCDTDLAPTTGAGAAGDEDEATGGDAESSPDDGEVPEGEEELVEEEAPADAEAGAANHGTCVSAAAADPAHTGRAKGAHVSSVARSDAGKDGAPCPPPADPPAPPAPATATRPAGPPPHAAKPPTPPAAPERAEPAAPAAPTPPAPPAGGGGRPESPGRPADAGPKAGRG